MAVRTLHRTALSGGAVHGAPQVHGLEEVQGLLGHAEIKELAVSSIVNFTTFG